ncbi:MAG TPA: N-formylglutamate amidohydrolase [Polyangiales bacterium]
MEFFELTLPAHAAIPLLVEVPHAGLLVPDIVKTELHAPQDALLRDADIYVDKLYDRAPSLGAALLVARTSRYVVDLNRAQNDVDAATVSDHPSPAFAQPRGVVWRATTDGRPVLRRPLSYAALQDRLTRFYVPYHKALREELEAMRARSGFAILLAGHSMPSRGRSLHVDTGTVRADVVPGTQGRSTADPRIIDLVDAHFRAAGLRVRHDDPYKGGFATTHYGRPREHLHAIQIELNRALYVDEDTFTLRRPDFEKLQALLDELLVKLGQLDLR